MNIAIINNVALPINYDSLEHGCGGSETWAVQISLAFAKRGHNITIFSDTEETEKSKTNEKFKIVNISLLSEKLNKEIYDFIIVSRIMHDELFELLNSTIDKSKTIVFYQFHDLMPYEGIYKRTMQYVDKIVALTPYHAKYLHKITDIDYSKFAIIPNGIDPELFRYNDNLGEPRNNRILWCSNPDRGLYLIMEELYHEIRKEIPDFGIDIAYPNYSQISNDTFLQRIRNDENFGVYAALSKNQLYMQMAKHKCWCYPQNFIDTFCIGILEQAMSDVDIVCPWWYGPSDIFGDLVNENRFEYKNYPGSEFEKTFSLIGYKADKEISKEYIEKLKNGIIDSLKNYDSKEHKEKRAKLKEYILQNYTWDRIAQMYENLYINEKLQKGNI